MDQSNIRPAVFFGRINLGSPRRVRAEALAWLPGLVLDDVSTIRSMTSPRHCLRQRLARRLRARRQRTRQPGDVSAPP